MVGLEVPELDAELLFGAQELDFLGKYVRGTEWRPRTIWGRPCNL